MDDEYNIYEELQLDTIPMDRVVPDLKDSSGVAGGDDDGVSDVKDVHEGKVLSFIYDDISRKTQKEIVNIY